MNSITSSNSSIRSCGGKKSEIFLSFRNQSCHKHAKFSLRGYLSGFDQQNVGNVVKYLHLVVQQDFSSLMVIFHYIPLGDMIAQLLTVNGIWSELHG